MGEPESDPPEEKPQPYSLEEVLANITHIQGSFLKDRPDIQEKYTEAMGAACSTILTLEREGFEPILYIRPSNFSLPPMLVLPDYLIRQLSVDTQKRRHEEAGAKPLKRKDVGNPRGGKDPNKPKPN
jgi:hypothetical protein